MVVVILVIVVLCVVFVDFEFVFEGELIFVKKYDVFVLYDGMIKEFYILNDFFVIFDFEVVLLEIESCFLEVDIGDLEGKFFCLSLWLELLWWIFVESNNDLLIVDELWIDMEVFEVEYLLDFVER